MAGQQSSSRGTANQQVIIAVLSERMDQIDCTLTEVKILLEKQAIERKTMDEKRSAFEAQTTDQATRFAMTQIDHATRLDALERLSKQTQEQMIALQLQLQPLILAHKLIAWFAGILGVSVIGLIVAIITGEAQIIFP